MESTIEDHQASNAILPISKLDDDVLSHIFMFNAHLNFLHVHIPSTTIRRTSQVYRRWRNLLLNYPLIWGASLDFGDPKAWVDIVLARAGDAPLNLVVPSISRLLLRSSERTRLYWASNHFSEFQMQDHFFAHSIKPSEPHSEDELDFALSLLPRCRRFVISVVSKLQSAFVANRIKRTSLISGSHLQEFALCVHPSHGVCLWGGSDIDIPVSEGSPTPQLKRLELIGSGTNLLSPSIGGLTCLSIADQLNGHGMPLKADEWLTVLRRLPLLEELSLSDCFITQTSISDDGFQENLTTPIPLSHLRSLTLSGHCVPCHEILSALRFPASCFLGVGYTDIDFIIHALAVAPMMSELCKKVQSNVQSTKVQSLSITQMSERFFGINNTWGGDVNRTLPLSIVLQFVDGSDIEMMLPELVHLLQIVSPDVNCLDFDISPGYSSSPSVLRKILEPFDQVDALHFCEEETLSSITAIHREPDLATRPIILPRLSELCLHRVAFYDEKHVEDCVDLLQRRLEMKAPIKRIVLQNCLGEVETLVGKLRNIDVELELLDSKLS